MATFWAIVIGMLVGGGLFGGGFVTGCSTGKNMTQTQDVSVNSKTEQRTSTEVNTMQGQITVIIQPQNTNGIMFFNINVDKLTNIKVWSSNFSDRFTVTNGKTNR